MPVDPIVLGGKLAKYREQFQLSFDELSITTGIPGEDLASYESGSKTPSGDVLLVLADFYKCDYKYFISNEKLAPFEQTDILFRQHGDEFSKADRWAVQEFLFLCDCEQFLLQEMGWTQIVDFKYSKVSSIHKTNGIDAARKLRNKLGYANNVIARNIYNDFKSIGLHLFRRALENSNISGLYVKHPFAGKCILINYSEDVYRQRFTAAHEAAHSILDDDQEVIVSFKKTDVTDYREVGANNFASHYLMPPDFLMAIPDARVWSQDKITEWASKLKVSVEALVYALRNQNLIPPERENELKASRVPRDAKEDPELPRDLPPLSRERKLILLKKGLSNRYVRLCFEAYHKQVVSFGRLAEMLLTDERQLTDLMDLYKETIKYAE
jgi:Zn-dependent peptidase ImmA (M78 family)